MKLWQRLWIPIPISLLLLLLIWLTKPFIITLSFFVGCCICWFGEFCFLVMLIGKIKKKRPEGFLWAFSLAEVLKLLIYSVLFVIAVEKFRLHVVPVFCGLMLNLILFWLLSITALGDI